MTSTLAMIAAATSRTVKSAFFISASSHMVQLTEIQTTVTSHWWQLLSKVDRILSDIFTLCMLPLSDEGIMLGVYSIQIKMTFYHLIIETYIHFGIIVIFFYNYYFNDTFVKLIRWLKLIWNTKLKVLPTLYWCYQFCYFIHCI